MRKVSMARKKTLTRDEALVVLKCVFAENVKDHIGGYAFCGHLLERNGAVNCICRARFEIAYR
jgi:hypothetical protein